MRKLLVSCCFVLLCLSAYAQLQTPSQFLGYELGAKFTPHHRVIAYFNAVSQTSPLVKTQVYGHTYEGRPLILAIIGSAENINRLPEIQANNLALTNADKDVKLNKQPAILWLSYNVHGNEASSTETALRVLYELASGRDEKINNWLKNTIVIIDPCLNPDGRDRYVNFFNGVAGTTPNADPESREHLEPWPTGRTNHYYFDLNRDWAWQTQIESVQRVSAYHKWLPQVHVDFHEQGYNEPYYFAPAAEPVHEAVTPWQKEFQVKVGKNNAKYFDEQGWVYFTKERFDLLYPSYGDTYPLYNGAIGMTFEQGGIKAGLAVVTADGDTLTLRDRIQHHFATSIATLETTSLHAAQLLDEFKKFFKQSLANKAVFKTYVVKADNIYRLRKLADLLTKNNIQYSFGANRVAVGFNYFTQKTESFKLSRNDLIVNVAQKHGVMANVLFEPNTLVSDSNTYDITAWALPYVYGLNAYALKEHLEGAYNYIAQEASVKQNLNPKPYAWVLSWGTTADAKLLITLQNAGIKVRVVEQSFTANGKTFAPGTLLVYRTDNEKKNPNVGTLINKLLQDAGANYTILTSGFVDAGKDLGSSTYNLIKVPKVGVLASSETSASALGEVWSFFEQELSYPITLINSLSNLDINRINVLIIPDGYYSDYLASQILPWINAGGKLIAMEDAVSSFIGKNSFLIKRKSQPSATNLKEQQKDQKASDSYANAISGATYKVHLNTKSSISYGVGNYFYAIKSDANVYEPLTDGVNIGFLKDDSYTSGLVGSAVKHKLNSGMLIGEQAIGRGRVVYLSTNVLFRLFLEGGKQIFINSLFL